MNYHPFRNLGLKLLALGMAVLLWLSVAGEPVVERGLQVPLGFENFKLLVTHLTPSRCACGARPASSTSLSRATWWRF